MSDLVRGIVREAPPAERAPERPAPERPADRAGAERPAVTPTRRMMLASLSAETQAPRREPAPPPEPPRAPEVPAESPEPLFGEIQQFLTEAHEVLRTNAALPWARLQALVDRAITALARSADLFWVANNPAAPPGVDYVAFHQARVCVLALRIGGGVGYDRPRLASLGQAAALFDVGLWQMPDSITRRGDTLTGEELALWRSHPRVSAEIVRRWGPPDEHVAQIILEHHEREQGQGFPQGLHGPAIDPDAKIIGLVDTYTALTMPPSARPRLRPHEAIRDIVKTRNDQFPSALVKALLSEISVFPPGTVVRLNTDEIGRVIAVNRNHPLRPKVEIMADGKGQRLPAPKVLDLSEAPFLYITGPIGEGGR
ncbi:MAG TPA: HD domain-containing phosphohydrolase [Methylomirabilota bacterium]|nr:HD domain-containing phosphohydrolase [Methylomirabilota bacterium]